MTYNLNNQALYLLGAPNIASPNNPRDITALFPYHNGNRQRSRCETDMAGGTYYPYASLQDATVRLGRFADRAVDPRCGLTWSDGMTLTVLRHARRGADGHGTYLNILKLHISAPPAPPPPAAKATGFFARAEEIFWRAMELEGQAEIDNARAQMAMSRAVIGAVRDDIWEPAHKYLMRHKKVADGVGVAVDVIGVVAGAAFVIFLAPEIGALAIATGVAAGAGSLILLLADGSVFLPEMTGNEALSQRNENSKLVQWARIIGTGLTLFDIPVGGVRALVEVGKLSREAREALVGARSSDELAASARERVAAIHNPGRHPGPVNRRLHKVQVLARQADAQRQAAQDLTHRMRVISARDVTASFVATPVGTALMVGSPPAMLLSAKQAKADANYLQLLEPEKGMPHDVKLEMRVSAMGRAAR